MAREAHPRALRPRVLEADPIQPGRCEARQPRPAQDLDHDDDQREAGRPRRAIGGRRHDRHGGVGRGREDRTQAAVSTARRALRQRQAESQDLRLRGRRLLLSRPGSRGAAARDASYIDRGYTVVKKKIGGASLDEDLRRIEAVLKILGPGQKLAVDANGRFDLATAIEYAKALSQYDLFWYEEPGDPLDFELQAELAQPLPEPMATGEDLFSMQDARNLIRYGGMRPDRDWLQFDCALSYGLVEYLRTLDMLREHGWSPSRCIPHGGHQMSLEHRRGPGTRRQRVVSRPVPAVRRVPGRRQGGKRLRDASGAARHRLRGQERPDQRDARAGVVTRAFAATACRSSARMNRMLGVALT